MKKFTYGIALFILASSFTIIYDASKDLVGKWKTAESSYPAARKIMIERMKKVSPENAEKMEAAGEQLDALFALLTFEFKAGGEYEISSSNEAIPPQTGKWKVTADGKYLERQADAGGSLRKDSIVEIKPTKVVLMEMETREQVEYLKAE